MRPILLETIAALRGQVAKWRKDGLRIGLVPTMGALHAGHISLVEALQKRGIERVVVSIFVNPTQFAPNEDFSKYPRTFDADMQKLAAIGASAVFAPSVAEMYPQGMVTTVTLAGPAKAGLEDAFRPTHFDGVATIVAKLLLQALPDVAIFGEKDYQQLAVIRQMALDLDIPVEIAGGKTIREASGLAMSSRNVYLSAKERETAALLYQAMQSCASAIRGGEPMETAMQTGRKKLSDAGFELQYLEARHAVTLAKTDKLAEPLRILVAAKIGATRLIDNIAV